MTVNEIIRSRAMDPETGRIKLRWELIAGGTAGGCQVVRTKLCFEGANIDVHHRSSQILWKLCKYRKSAEICSGGTELYLAEKSGCKCKEKLHDWRAFRGEVLCISFVSWVFSACTKGPARVCFVISRSLRFTFPRILI